MADKNIVQEVDKGQVMIDRAKNFWTKYQKPIIGVCGAVILIGGGWLVYKNFFKEPNEKKAANAIFKAEEYYRLDSVKQALNGDGANAGFLKIISQYSGTKAANMAHYYAAVCYTKLDDNANVIKHLKKFSTSAKQTQQRAYRLLADAYGDTGNFKEAFEYYKKSAYEFEEDERNAAAALFYAAYTAQRALNKPADAIKLYKELKEKYPAQNEFTSQADALLAELGVYNTEN
jgi:tetratricopeptide (TPR) repeat protein